MSQSSPQSTEQSQSSESESSQAIQTSNDYTQPVESVAQRLSKQQKKISISQFLETNRQMLGFSSPGRNLFITVKQITDNAMDAADDAGMLPSIEINITRIKPKLYRVHIQDYGPGIVKENVPKVFGTLLYGSKFNKNEQRRGQQGLGVSAAVLSSQIDTGKPTTVISKCKDLPAISQDIMIDVDKNAPIITNSKRITVPYQSGVSVSLLVKGAYIKEGKRSIRYYLNLISVLNPYAQIKLVQPDGEIVEYKRTQQQVPTATTVSKVHPKTIELGVFQRLLRAYSGSLEQFLTTQLHSGNSVITTNLLERFCLDGDIRASALCAVETEQLYEALQTMNFLVPEESLVTIGEAQLLRAMKAEDHQFSVAITGVAKLFKNTVAKVEAVLIYDSYKFPKEQRIDLIRAVNKTPLLLQQSACVLTKAVAATNWKNYGLQQGKGQLPTGPVRLFVHLAGLRIGFTSESKEAVAENHALELYLRQQLRRLGLKLSKKLRYKEYIQRQKEKADFIFKHLPQLYRSVGAERNHLAVYSKVLNAVLYYAEGTENVFVNYSGPKLLKTGIQIPQGITRVSSQQGTAVVGLHYEAPNTVPREVSGLIPRGCGSAEIFKQPDTVLEKIQLVLTDLREQLNTGNPASLQVRIRNKRNMYLHEAGYWTLGDRRSEKSIQRVAGLVTVVQLVKLMNLIRAQLSRNKTNSLRECYYQSESWGSAYKFDSQQQSDQAIQTLEVLLGCSREDFGIYPQLRGQIAGPVTYIEQTLRGPKVVDCTLDLPLAGGGITIPHKVAALTISDCKARFILAIETAGMFNRVLENKFNQRYNCILISLVGQPTRAIKQLIQMLNRVVGSTLDVFVFADCDGWSLLIHASIQYGAAKTAHMAERLVLPSAIHLGLKYTDIAHYGLPTDKLTKQDVLCLQRLLTDPRFKVNPEWQPLLEAQLAGKTKCEQQALAALDIDYVTNQYLPAKLRAYGYEPL